MRCTNEKFADLGTPRRVWAVGAINGDLRRLVALHDHLAARFAIGDRIVYLGNYLGVGNPRNMDIIDELLVFRSALLAKPGMMPTDIVHLRGPAEEAWQRLLRLQFAPLPGKAVDFFLASGVAAYLGLYNVALAEANAMGRASSVSITRWTNRLRNAQRGGLGHEPWMCSLRRAAITKAPVGSGQHLLFVPAGFDPSRSLDDQGDHFWYSTKPFSIPKRNALPYSRVVRGFDVGRGGMVTDGAALTLDGGCGFGGLLACGCFNSRGDLAEVVTIGGQSAVGSAAYDTPGEVLGPPPIRAPATLVGNRMALSA